MTDVQADPADFNPAQPSWWAWKGDISSRLGNDVIGVVEATWHNDGDLFGRKRLFIENTIAVAGAEGDNETYALLENRREVASALSLEEFRALVRGGIFVRIG